jgi:ABC-2 type transport system ATP-binding protein
VNAKTQPPPQMSPSDDFPLQARQLTKTYECRTVLDRVTLNVPQGAVLGLIGRNGAGKSTLLRCLLGLIEPGGGDAFVFGEPALAMTDRSKQRLAYVPQKPDALDWLQIGEMLDFVGRFYPRWDKHFVDTILRRWDLPRERILKTLSPGERQRVAVVRALAPCPELLVLDEPAASMDPVARRDLLREVVTRAADSGTTIVFSTHIVSDLERVASHVAFLHAGRLLLHAPLDDLKECVARITVPAIVAEKLVDQLPGELSRRPLEGGGLALVMERAVDGEWSDIVKSQGTLFDALGLEDLFIEVVE